MRRKLKNLKNKSGHTENGAPRQMIDEALYLERRSASRFDSEYAGWSWATRPRDQAISLRRRGAGSTGISGASGATGPTPPREFVDLGHAGDFAIFAFSGITTTGGSSIHGDMGVNPIAIGPDPGVSITGFILTTDGGGQFSTSAQVHSGGAGFPLQLGHVFGPDYAPPTPAKTVAAHNALLAAYTDASTRVAGLTTPGIDLGGSTLEGGTGAAGVYHYTGAATSVGVGTPLTLHGTLPGDGIIIIIDGTFAVHADILLTGTLAGHPENVYFVVAGTTAFFTGVTANGEFLGATTISTADASVIINGRLLSKTNVTLVGSTVNEK